MSSNKILTLDKSKKPWEVCVVAHKEILTNEDWCPTIEGKIHVSLTKYESDQMWRVSVWGGDDLGMKFDTHEEGFARWIFDHVVNLTTQADLVCLGFQYD